MGVFLSASCLVTAGWVESHTSTTLRCGPGVWDSCSAPPSRTGEVTVAERSGLDVYACLIGCAVFQIAVRRWLLPPRCVQLRSQSSSVLPLSRLRTTAGLPAADGFTHSHSLPGNTAPVLNSCSSSSVIHSWSAVLCMLSRQCRWMGRLCRWSWLQRITAGSWRSSEKLRSPSAGRPMN